MSSLIDTAIPPIEVPAKTNNCSELEVFCHYNHPFHKIVKNNTDLLNIIYYLAGDKKRVMVQSLSTRFTGIMTILASSVVIIIAFAALGFGVWYWMHPPEGSGESVFITSMSAFGTLILAAVTFFSVRQGQQSVAERKKERTKPIVKDEMVKVTQPAIDALSANVEMAKSETGVDWVYSYPSIYRPAGDTSDRASSVFADPAPVAMVQLQDTRPDLWSRLEDHEEMIKRLTELGDGIQERMETPLLICIDELDWEVPESEDNLNIKLLVSAAVKGSDKFGEASDYYTFWERHGEEIKSLVRALAENELDQLNNLESRWQNHCEELRDDLSEHKVELQQEFGISESTIGEELEEWPTII